MSETEQKQKPKIEYVDLTISLPKSVLEFLQVHEKELNYPSLKKYLEDIILQTVRRDIEDGAFKFEILATITAVLGDEE